jgi:hypothetical protein
VRGRVEKRWSDVHGGEMLLAENSLGMAVVCRSHASLMQSRRKASSRGPCTNGSQSWLRSRNSKLLTIILAMRTWPTQVEASQNFSTTSRTAPSRLCHRDGPFQRQGSFRAIRDDILYSIPSVSTTGSPKKPPWYMIDVLYWMCLGGCATHALSV